MSDVHYLQGYSHRPGRSGWPGAFEGIGPPPRTVRLTVTPLVGYRFWTVERRTGRFGVRWPRADATLVSLVTGTEWEGPVLRADERPGWELRGHGIYAFDRASAGAAVGGAPLDNWVLGEVQGMGRCVVHERGWRAGVARITRLFVDPALDLRLRRKLRARYRCEVQPFEPSDW